MRPLALIVATLTAAAGLQPATLPRGVRAALDRAYPGWRFATIAPTLRPELAPGQRAEWVSGDFDADGRRDFAVQIVRAVAPAESAQVTVAFLRRPGGRYARYVVHAGGVHQGIFLGRGTRGSRGRDLEADTEFVYHADAVEIIYGQEAGETCLFLRGRFRCLITSD